MSDECLQAVSDRWTEFQRLHGGGAIYSALTRLGEIQNCLEHECQSGAAAEKWRARLGEVTLPDDDLFKARAFALDSLDRLMRMINAGGKFSYEELLLAISMRVELQMFNEFLRSRKLDEIDTAAVDQRLNGLAHSGESASTLRNAQRAAKENWGIPLSSPWLEEF